MNIDWKSHLGCEKVKILPTLFKVIIDVIT